MCYIHKHVAMGHVIYEQSSCIIFTSNVDMEYFHVGTQILYRFRDLILAACSA